MTTIEIDATQYAKTMWLIHLIEQALNPKTTELVKFKMYYRDDIRKAEGFYPFDLDQQALRLLHTHYKQQAETLINQIEQRLLAEHQKDNNDNSN